MLIYFIFNKPLMSCERRFTIVWEDLLQFAPVMYNKLHLSVNREWFIY